MVSNVVGYKRRQSYKRKSNPDESKKVDVFLSGKIFGLYRQKLMFEKGVCGENFNIFEFDKKLKESKRRVRDDVIKENIEYLLENINDNCPGNLDGNSIEKSITAFKNYLLEEFKIKYDINLVIDGNL